MQMHIKLGRVFGVDVGLHYSWLVIAVLIAFSLASQFRLEHPGWTDGLVWGTALVTAVLFVAIVVHELSHALVAKANQIPVKSITLFTLGGVAQIQREAATAAVEFWMGIVGPMTSAALGGLCLGAVSLLGWTPAAVPASPLTAVLVWLGYINFVLAIFNMVPGFPLDGGRVLRAALWWTTGDSARATRTATQVGKVVALMFIALGLVSFVTGAGVGGLWAS